MTLRLAGGCVLDGTGAPEQARDVFVSGAHLAPDPGGARGAEDLDCSGLFVTPAFVDTHTHSDLVVFDDPSLAFKARQGVGCDVLGQDGLGAAPVRAPHIAEVRRQLAGLDGDPDIEWDWRSVGDYLSRLEGLSPGIDLAFLVPHGQVRRSVMGMEDRAPDGDELADMLALLDRGLSEGALGMSTGLIYPPCCYAETAELEALCSVVAQHDGIFVVHIRSEGDCALESVAEVLGVAQKTGCRLCISHIKLAGQSNWGKLDAMIDLVRAARDDGVAVTADQYPYTAGSTMMGAILPPWAHAGSLDATLMRLGAPDTRKRLIDEISNPADVAWDNFWKWSGADGIRIADVARKGSPNRRFIGSTLAAAAGERDPLPFALDLLLQESMGVSMVAFSQSEAVIERLYAEPWVGVCTDGLCGGRPHPRTFGAFPKALRWLVRERGLVDWPEAVRKMTTLPATSFGMHQLGRLEPGRRANVVAFDPERVKDVSTYDDPQRFPEGIVHVVIGGRVVVRDGQWTGAGEGRVHRA